MKLVIDAQLGQLLALQVHLLGDDLAGLRLHQRVLPVEWVPATSQFQLNLFCGNDYSQ